MPVTSLHPASLALPSITQDVDRHGKLHGMLCACMSSWLCRSSRDLHNEKLEETRAGAGKGHAEGISDKCLNTVSARTAQPAGQNQSLLLASREDSHSDSQPTSWNLAFGCKKMETRLAKAKRNAFKDAKCRETRLPGEAQTVSWKQEAQDELTSCCRTSSPR